MRKAIILLGVATLTAPALGQVVSNDPAIPPPASLLGEPHLSIVPRTEAETARIAAVTAPPTDFSAPHRFETLPGGAASARRTHGRAAFSQHSANMPLERRLEFRVGDGLFKKLWISAPASTQASDGLGPLFNARACQRCHVKDGRGAPPRPGRDSVSMFLRLSVPAAASDLPADALAYLHAAPEPTYGLQLQDRSIPGVPAEGGIAVTYEDVEVALSGGETATLRRPAYTVANPAYGPLHPEAMLSPRVAPPMIGLGLLEAIPEADILANADPDDADGDGISGRPAVVWSSEYNQWMLGRFGWKAGEATIRSQSAGAFHGDMGLSTLLHPPGWGECSPAQTACRAAPDGADDLGDGFEVSQEALDLVTFYSRNLAPPRRRRAANPRALRGKEVFHAVGCAACHTPAFVTHRLTDRPEQSFQLIWPHTDMLLHDMGAGLADGRPEWTATGREWRTAPLWGIGRTEDVSGHTFFLHDGRARSLLEAILWHGGEAQTARDAVITMRPEDRAALVAYLESL